MAEITQSEEWSDVLKFIEQQPQTRIPGFPFSVPFPRLYGGRKYEIILVSGQKLLATVNSSREFSSEGLEWDTTEGRKARSAVAAWKLHS